MEQSAFHDYEYGPWQLVPWWHWRAWFCRNFVSAPMLMRRQVWPSYSIGGKYDAMWEYADVETIAFKLLAEQFGSPNYVA